MWAGGCVILVKSTVFSKDACWSDALQMRIASSELQHACGALCKCVTSQICHMQALARYAIKTKLGAYILWGVQTTIAKLMFKKPAWVMDHLFFLTPGRAFVGFKSFEQPYACYCVLQQVSNTSLARDGYPTMALTACFASPLFILLAGVRIFPVCIYQVKMVALWWI